MFTMDRHDQERLYEDRTNPWDYESYMPTPGNRRYDQMGMPRAHSDDTMRMHEMMQYENEMARLQQEIARIDSQYSRDVIRSPDIRTFESHSEVRTQFQHPEVRIKY